MHYYLASFWGKSWKLCSMGKEKLIFSFGGLFLSLASSLLAQTINEENL